MSNNKRILVPRFLQKLDDSLLRNKPAVWQIRTHLVLFFALVFAAVLSLFCFLVFFDAKQYSNVSSWVTFTALIVVIGFVFWMIFLLRFNVFKRFGNWHTFDGLKSFALYFVSIGAMVAVCFIPSLIETYRANHQFGNEEIVNDINELNTTACKLEYNLLPKKWVGSKYKVVDSGDVRLKGFTYDDVAVAPAETYIDTVVTVGRIFYDTVASSKIDSGNLRYNYIDTAELRRKLNSEDSVFKINDSVYVFYQCPDYLFVKPGNADRYTSNKVFTSAELYRIIIPGYQKPNRMLLEKRMRELEEKWAVNDRYGTNSWQTTFSPDDNYDVKITKKYDLYRVSNGIGNAVEKKYEWKNNWWVYLRVFYYTALFFTMLVFIFRHSTTKTFFLSLLTAVIFIILTSLFMLLSYNESETSLLSFIIVYYVIFSAIALSLFGARVRSAVQGIGLNLFFFLTPFMPLVLVALNHVIKRRRYDYNSIYINDYHNWELYYLIAEIAGIVILLVLLEPLFKKLYRKWFAAPEN